MKANYIYNKSDLDFYCIKEFACQHFYSWEDGEDFIWLKNEWNKFKPHLESINQVEDFILTLSNIYYNFCHEAYFMKVSDNKFNYPHTIDEINIQFNNLDTSNRALNFYDNTLDILLRIYGRPCEILRELISIAINNEVPHPDGYNYIYNLLDNKYNEIIIKDDL